MNQIRAIQALNKKELEAGIHNPNASWHTDYRDTAFVYFGGLPYSLSEGDVITIFSQYGEPVFLKLVRDEETGKSKGFGWLKYEDQRSTDLAVDNLGGAEINGRLVRVDHARYKPRKGKEEEEMEAGRCGWEDIQRREHMDKIARGEDMEMMDESESEEEEVRRPILPEERDLAKLIAEHDEDDPMKAFLVEEKKKEVVLAVQKLDKKGRNDKERKHRHSHRHHRSQRSRRDESDGDHDREHRRSRKERDAISCGDERKRDHTPEARGRDRDSKRHREWRRRDDHNDLQERRRDRDHRRDRSHEDKDGHGRRWERENQRSNEERGL